LLKTGGVARSRVALAPGGSPTSASGDTKVSFFSSSPATVEARLNQQNPLAVQIQQRTFQKGDNKVVDEYLNQPAGTYRTQLDGRYYLLEVKQSLAPGPKRLADAAAKPPATTRTTSKSSGLSSCAPNTR